MNERFSGDNGPRAVGVNDPERLALIQNVLAEGSLLRGALDLLTEAVTAALGVPVALVTLVDVDRQHFLGQTGVGSPFTEGTPISHSFCQQVVLEGSALMIDESTSDSRVSENPAIDDLGVAAYVGQPLIISGRVLGSVCAIDHRSHAWSAEELTTLRRFADLAEYLIEARLKTQRELHEQVASAAINSAHQDARIHAFERQTDEQGQVEALSRRLQNALLAPARDDSDFQIDSFYEPGSQRLLLGGDFADTMVTDDGRLHFVIGDVTGHGPEAAALAISLRASWRALQGVGVDEAQTMAELDRQCASSDLFATVLIGVVGPERTLCIASAGHPAPVLVQDGCAREMDAAYGPMLGIGLDNPRWRVVEAEIAEAEIIVFTDGLTEGRVPGVRERFGVERLLEAITARGSDPPALYRAAVAANGGVLPDDVAIMRISAPGR